MIYWIFVLIGLSLGSIPTWYYIKSVFERKQSGYSTPYTRMRNLALFNNSHEHQVYETLKDTFDVICGPNNYFLSKGPLILTHAPGKPIPTCEIDHLVICSFGVFVVETKGWNGTIQPGSTRDKVVVEFQSGKRESRRSPITQCISKVDFIKKCQPCNWRVESVIVFSHAGAWLAPGLPENVIRIRNIRQYFEGKRKERMPGEVDYVDVQLALGSIYIHRDRRPNAFILHTAAIQRQSV